MMPGNHKPFYDSSNGAREYIYFYNYKDGENQLKLAENQ